MNLPQPNTAISFPLAQGHALARTIAQILEDRNTLGSQPSDGGRDIRDGEPDVREPQVWRHVAGGDLTVRRGLGAVDVAQLQQAEGLRQIARVGDFGGPGGQVGAVGGSGWVAEVVQGERPSVHGEDGAHAHEVDIEVKSTLGVPDAEHEVVELVVGRGAVLGEWGVVVVSAWEKGSLFEGRRRRSFRGGVAGRHA